MNDIQKDKALKLFLLVFGIGSIFVIYPLHIVWPSGWAWHHGEGEYYFQMIAIVYAVLGVFLIKASKNPGAHISLLWFTIWANLGHGVVMLIQALMDNTETGHLMGDVPFLFITSALMAYLMPKSKTA